MHSYISPELYDDMCSNGICPQSGIRQSTNGFYRFSLKPGNPNDDCGWIKFYRDFASYGDMRKTDDKFRFWYEPQKRSREEQTQIRYQIEQDNEDCKRHQEMMAKAARMIFADASPAASDHPYLIRKNVAAHGIKVTGDNRLMIPGYDAQGKLSTIQFIDTEGNKQFLTGARSAGCFFIIGNPQNDKRILLAEGYATAASAYEQTGNLTFIAFSAGNLSRVASIVRGKHPESKIIILADNDESRTGEKAALCAAKATGAYVVLMPEIGTDANDFVNRGGDLEELIRKGE